MNKNGPSYNDIDFYNYFQIVAKRKKLIAILFIFFVTVTAIVNFNMPKIYQGEASFRIMSPRLPGLIIKNSFSEQGNQNLFTTKELIEIVGKIDQERIAHIFSKKTYTVHGLKIMEIKESKDKFKIVIESTNPEFISEALNDFWVYLMNIDNIKFYQQKITNDLNERIKEISNAKKKGDIIEKTLDKMLLTTRLMSIGFNPLEINQKSFEMNMEKYQLEKEVQSFMLLKQIDQSFIYKDFIKPKIARNVILAGLFSLFLGIMIAFFLNYLEQNRKLYATKDSPSKG